MRIFLKKLFSSAKAPTPKDDIKETLKKFENKLAEFKNLKTFKKLDGISSLSLKNDKLYQDFSKTLSEVVQKCANSTLLNKTSSLVEGARESVRPHIEYVKQSEVFQEASASAEKIESQVKTYLDFYDYGGVSSKEHRDILKNTHHVSLPEDRVTHDVVVSKKKSFSRNFGEFIPSLSLPKSRNIFIHFVTELLGSIGSKLQFLLGESETAKAIRNIKTVDCNFTTASFVKYAQGYLIPEFLEALLNEKSSSLKHLTSDSLYAILCSQFNQNIAQTRPSALIADIRNCEFKEAKRVDSNCFVLVSCSVQQINESKGISSENMIYIFSFLFDADKGRRWVVNEYYGRRMD